MTWSSAFTPLRNRNFAWYFASRFVNTLGNMMASIALAFAVLDLTDSPSALGQVLAAHTIPMIALLLYGGVIADRFPRTLVPSQSTTAATNGTGMPGAAKDTMVNVRTSPVVATSDNLNSVLPHEAQALRRSKKRAPQDVHSWATRCGSSPSTR